MSNIEAEGTQIIESESNTADDAAGFRSKDELYVGRVFESEDEAKALFQLLYPDMIVFSRRELHKTGVNMGKPKVWVVSCKYGGVPRRSANAVKQRVSKKCGCKFLINLRVCGDDTRPIITTSYMEHTGHDTTIVPRSLSNDSIVHKHSLEQDKDSILSFMRSSILMRTSRKDTLAALLLSKFAGKQYSADAKTYLWTLFASVEASLDGVCSTANLISVLQSQNKRVYTHLCPTTGVVQCVMWLSEVQMTDIIQFGDVVIVDTTAKKNKLKYPLILIIGINAENKSIILAQGLLHDETYDSFKFIMESLLHAAAMEQPAIQFSDEDPAMVQAVADVLPSTIALRCDWHHRENIKKKIRGTVQRDLDSVMEMFYEVRNAATEPEFESKWVTLVHLIDTQWPSLKDYFASMYDTRDRWAHHYRSKLMHLNVYSTQRVESVNGRVAEICNAGSSLDCLIHALETISTNIEIATADASAAAHQGTQLSSVLQFRTLLESVGVAASRYASRKITEEAGLAMQYFVNNEEAIDTAVFFDVTRLGFLCNNDTSPSTYRVVVHKETGHVSCHCSTRYALRIPCRHVFAVILQSTRYRIGFHANMLHRRWLLRNCEAAAAVYARPETSDTITLPCIASSVSCAVISEWETPPIVENVEYEAEFTCTSSPSSVSPTTRDRQIAYNDIMAKMRRHVDNLLDKFSIHVVNSIVDDFCLRSGSLTDAAATMFMCNNMSLAPPSSGQKGRPKGATGKRYRSSTEVQKPRKKTTKQRDRVGSTTATVATSATVAAPLVQSGMMTRNKSKN